MVPTLNDVLIWAEDVPLSTAQVQKAYDWRISQQAGIANAALVAMFTLITSSVIEGMKQTLSHQHSWIVIVAGELAFGGIYLVARLRIRALRQEFLAFYSLLGLMR